MSCNIYQSQSLLGILSKTYICLSSIQFLFAFPSISCLTTSLFLSMNIYHPVSIWRHVFRAIHLLNNSFPHFLAVQLLYNSLFYISRSTVSTIVQLPCPKFSSRISDCFVHWTNFLRLPVFLYNFLKYQNLYITVFFHIISVFQM